MPKAESAPKSAIEVVQSSIDEIASMAEHVVDINLHREFNKAVDTIKSVLKQVKL